MRVCNKQRSKNPLGTKGRTSILSYREYRASCGASFSVSRKNCMTSNVASLRSVKGATLPCDACASIPCGCLLYTSFSPAVELSYLTHDEQKQFLDAMDYSQNTPSLSQAQRLKKLSREGKCTKEAMRSIMSEEKKEEQERITLSSDTLRKYFPRSYTPLQMQQTIIKLLEQWQKKQQRRNER